MLSATLDLLTGRRSFLAGAAGLAVASLSAPALAQRRRLDFADPRDHLRTFIKMSASEEPGAQVYMLYDGVTFGVTNGTELRPLYRMSGLSPVRTFLQPDGSYRILAREASVFTDLASGEVLQTWRNPYLDDRAVEVWHLRNGPLNYALHPDKPISGGGWRLLRPSVHGENSFFMPVEVRDGQVSVAIDAQANRKNPLDPAVWKNESSGPSLRYSEHNTWRAALTDLEDPRTPAPQVFAAWHSHKQWRPWMLMGQRPGHIYNHLTARKAVTLDGAPRSLLAWYERHAPEFLTAPTEWRDDYMTDWDYFKTARKPT